LKVFYQTEWHGISFRSFARTSAIKVANAGFYNAFYQAFFARFKSYEELDGDWRKAKEDIAEWLVKDLIAGKRIMSIGCGIGFMEQYLWGKFGSQFDLHVSDYASDAHRWLNNILPVEQIHTGGEVVNSCDLIYLSAVDYALQDDELVELLLRLRSCLLPGGKLVIISASFLEKLPAYKRFISSVKDIIKWLLNRMGLRHRGQLWGWMRSRSEYQSIMLKAGFTSVSDGFIATRLQKAYWIKGAVT